MRLSRYFFSLIAIPTIAAQASPATWPPITPEIWALKEDPATGIKDAVILEDRTVIKDAGVERVLRIRVLSEAGRKAAHLGDFSEACYAFNGRTVYPDGKVVTFDKRQDFRREETSFGNLAKTRTMLVPPGVTGDCVVELRWNERVAPWSPLPASMGNHAYWRFGKTYFTLLQAVEIRKNFPWAYSALDGRTLKVEMEETERFKIFSARNIPATEQPPYSLEVSLDRPLLVIFFQPGTLWREVDKGIKAYWNALGPRFWQDSFESDIQKGRHYKAFKARLFPLIKSKGPQAIAQELLTLLNQEILNASRMTHAEFAKHPKGQLIPGYKSLGEICETKTARGDGMLRLYYHLLLDLDIAPKIALVADREERLFNPKLMNPWQLTNVMLAVEELGASPILLNPSARFAPASIIHPDFQGVQGLLLDPKADWASEAFQVPIQPATLNTKGFEYSLVLGEEEDRFQLTAHFKGFPEFAERWRYMINEPAEQNRLLKEHFEKTLKGASIEKTEVLNAVNPKETVSWRVEGTLEPKGGRQRTIEPFPGMPWPLWVPDSFPKERSLPIVMPYLQTQTSRSVIKVPKGFQVRPVRPYQEQNRFGHVSWSMKQSPSGDENLAEVTLEVGLNTMFAGPDGYEDLKVFLGWISDACRRTLIMEKV